MASVAYFCVHGFSSDFLLHGFVLHRMGCFGYNGRALVLICCMAVWGNGMHTFGEVLVRT